MLLRAKVSVCKKGLMVWQHRSAETTTPVTEAKGMQERIGQTQRVAKGVLAGKYAAQALNAGKIAAPYPTTDTAQRPVTQAFTASYAPAQNAPHGTDGTQRRPRVRPADASPSPRRGQSAEPMRPAGEQASDTLHPVGVALDNYYANNVDTLSVERRRKDFDLREQMQKYSTNERFEGCGRKVVASGGVGMQVRNGRARYTGLATCGSVWLCSVCAKKVQRRRQDEVEQTLRRHFAKGGGVMFLTLTLPHYVNDSLGRLMDVVVQGYQKVRQDRHLKPLQMIRALEVTHGKNGWHPHLHVLMLTPAPVTDAELQDTQARVFRVWERHERLKMGRGVSAECCPVLRADSAEVGAYAAKMSITYEVTAQASKDGRKDGRTPFQIAADFVASGDAEDLRLWAQYEYAVQGRKQLTWTKGIRLSQDEDLAAQAEAEPQDEVHPEVLLYTIPAPAWRVVKQRRGCDALLLHLLETKGADAVHEHLTRLMADAAAKAKISKSDTGGAGWGSRLYSAREMGVGRTHRTPYTAAA